MHLIHLKLARHKAALTCSFLFCLLHVAGVTSVLRKGVYSSKRRIIAIPMLWGRPNAMWRSWAQKSSVSFTIPSYPDQHARVQNISSWPNTFLHFTIGSCQRDLEQSFPFLQSSVMKDFLHCHVHWLGVVKVPLRHAEKIGRFVGAIVQSTMDHYRNAVVGHKFIW